MRFCGLQVLILAAVGFQIRLSQTHGEGGLSARTNNRFRKKDDSEYMDIPVMPHPGTDTQASPYQSRQTKEIT